MSPYWQRQNENNINQRGGRKPYIQNRYQQKTKNTLSCTTEGQQMDSIHNSNYAIDLTIIDPRQLTRSNVTLANCIEQDLEVIEKFARDQYCSRFIPQQSESASEEDKHSVFLQIQHVSMSCCPKNNI